MLINRSVRKLPSERSPQPAWLQRLWANQRVPLGAEKLYWWGVQVLAFLGVARREQWEGPVEVLAARFLEELKVSQPPLPPWRIDQGRQALEVFARGIEHWHFRRDEAGRLQPGFRVKPAGRTSVESQALVPGAPATLEEHGESRADAAWASSGNATRQEEEPWRDQLVAAIRLRRYSLRTEEAYREWVERFARYHSATDPQVLGEAEVREFLEYLAVARNVAASTQNQALSALLFFYQVVLDRPLGDLGGVVRAKRAARLPAVLSGEEVQRLLQGMEGTVGIMSRLLYGTGMRLMEAVRLRVKDVDFDCGLITVREGKGDHLQIQNPKSKIQSWVSSGLDFELEEVRDGTVERGQDEGGIGGGGANPI